MSPFPADPVDATGPMRVVLCAFPAGPAAEKVVAGAIDRRLAACAQRIAVDSDFLWEGRRTRAAEVLVLFKTAPVRVGALFRYLESAHPYSTPEILELDVPRAHPPYLAWLLGSVGAATPPPIGPLRHRGSPRGRGARGPGRTPARHRPRSRGTGRPR